MDENARILCGGMEYFELKLYKKTLALSFPLLGCGTTMRLNLEVSEPSV